MAEYLAGAGHYVAVVCHDGKNENAFIENNHVNIYSLRNDDSFIREAGGRLGKITKYKNVFSLLFYLYYLNSERKQKKNLRKKIDDSLKETFMLNLVNVSFDVVISSIYNIDAYYIAKTLRKQLEIPKHICDVRDPIVNPFFGSKPQAMIGRYRLKDIYNNVDAFTACYDYILNEIKENISFNKKNMYVLTHAYKEYVSNVCEKGECLKISSIGTYYPTNHNPLPLVEALYEMDNNKNVSPNSLQIILAGRNSDLLAKAFSDKGLSSYITDYGFVSHEDAVELEKESDVLLFLSFIEEVSSFAGVTGKFPEYLAMNKEILMVFDVRNDSGEQIDYFNKLSVGLAVDSRSDESKKQIIQWLQKKISEKQSDGLLHTPNMDLVEEYSVETVGAKLEEILDTVL
ncbi:MAG: hypothetical protein K5871_04890 [Lachnospiraceae bacterium]|nr:hypothetical protein [Lachnospiraceae bacterium]